MRPEGEPGRQARRRPGTGRKSARRSTEARHQEDGRLILSARCLLATTGAVLQWIETELGKLAGQFVDSPQRDAMAEQEIPTDVPTALQEAVESFQASVGELRASVDEAANYTKEQLERHWREHRHPTPRNEGSR